MPELGDGKGNEAGKLPGLSEQELALLKKLFSAPLEIPDDWVTWLVSRIEAQPPQLPISQIFGYQQVTPQSATAPGLVTLGGPTGWSSRTGGPELTELPSGSYVVQWGALIANTSVGSPSQVGIRVNGVDPGTDPAVDQFIESRAGNRVPGAMSKLLDLTEELNTLEVVYRLVDGTTGEFVARWLVAMKYANL